MDIQYAKFDIVFTNSPIQPAMMKSSSQKLEVTWSATAQSATCHNISYLARAVRPPKTGGSGLARYGIEKDILADSCCRWFAWPRWRETLLDVPARSRVAPTGSDAQLTGRSALSLCVDRSTTWTQTQIYINI